MIKMVIFDLDGTLLSSQKEILKENLEALIQAQKKGIKVVLATGRNVLVLDEIKKQLKLDEFKTGYCIGVNGLQIYDCKTTTLEKLKSLSFEQIKMIKAKAKKHRFNTIAFSDDCSYISSIGLIGLVLKNKTFIKKIFNKRFDGRLPKAEISKYEDGIEDINKICLLASPRKSTKAIKAELEEFQFMQVHHGWNEIMLPGINKASAILKILEKENITTDEIAVFGDSENDLEMLKMTKNSYAMGNAMENVKVVASHVIESHNEPGIAKVLQEILNLS